jgi:hypothetical protein
MPKHFVSMEIGARTLLFTISIIVIHLLHSNPDDTATVLLSFGTIYYCAWEKGLKMLNISDKSVSDIINSNMTNVYYVATSEDNLYL